MLSLLLIGLLHERHYAFHQTTCTAQLIILPPRESGSFIVPVIGFCIAIPPSTACAEPPSARCIPPPVESPQRVPFSPILAMTAPHKNG